MNDIPGNPCSHHLKVEKKHGTHEDWKDVIGVGESQVLDPSETLAGKLAQACLSLCYGGIILEASAANAQVPKPD